MLSDTGDSCKCVSLDVLLYTWKPLLMVTILRLARRYYCGISIAWCVYHINEYMRNQRLIGR